MHRLNEFIVKSHKRLQEPRRTNDATRFIHNNELTITVVKKHFDWSRSHWRFMTMDNIPVSNIPLRQQLVRQHNKAYSIRSPSFRIVSGRAIFPLTVVTPDSSAYL